MRVVLSKSVPPNTAFTNIVYVYVTPNTYVIDPSLNDFAGKLL